MTLIRALLVVALLWLPSSSSAQVIPQPGGGATDPQTATNTTDIATNTAAIAAIGDTWTTPTFSAGDFTANDSMTWTVEEADVLEYKFVVIGKTMTVLYVIAGSSVGGTPSTRLQIAVPNSAVVEGRSRTAAQMTDNAANVVGLSGVNDTSTVIFIERLDAAVYTASTNTTVVTGTIVFEIE